MATATKPKVEAKSDEAPKLKRTEESAALEGAGKALTALGGEGEQPRFGTARAAGPGPVPRVCHQLERAGNGLRRYKVFADTLTGRTPTKYVLAGDQAAAAKLYADKFKLKAEQVSVIELAD